jgi:hypothetical protein
MRIATRKLHRSAKCGRKWDGEKEDKTQCNPQNAAADLHGACREIARVTEESYRGARISQVAPGIPLDRK